jgi:hypothetical protein
MIPPDLGLMGQQGAHLGEEGGIAGRGFGEKGVALGDRPGQGGFECCCAPVQKSLSHPQEKDQGFNPGLSHVPVWDVRNLSVLGWRVPFLCSRRLEKSAQALSGMGPKSASPWRGRDTGPEFPRWTKRDAAVQTS